MLTGMDKSWFEQYQKAQRDITYARDNRRQGIFGIACDDDDLALTYQEAEYRRARAEHALTGKWWPDALKMFRRQGLRARAKIQRRRPDYKNGVENGE